MLWKAVLVFVATTTTLLLPAIEGAVLCYYESWAVYRAGQGRVTPDDLDPFACTHYAYAFASINPDNTIKVGDMWADLCIGGGLCGFKKFNNLKASNPDLKTLLSVGGWNVGSRPFSMMAATAATRATFIASTMNLLKTHNFDGLDVSWSYPTFSGGAPQDKNNFVYLLQELNDAMSDDGMVVTISVAPTVEIASQAYDIPSLSAHAHLVSVMTYNFHGIWEPYTHHLSPLYPFVNDSPANVALTVSDSIKYWRMSGMAANKLLMGIAMFGQCWTLDTAMDQGYYTPASQPGSPGPWTQQWGFMAYGEICKAQKEEYWTITKETGCNEPYTYHMPSNKIWCSYEDSDSVTIKAQFAADEGLAGLMVWSINNDDAQGYCSGRKFDLTLTLADTFNTAAP